MKTVKISHLSSAHPRYDTRILIKECLSLEKIENYEVSLVIADNLGDEILKNVSIYDVGKDKGRIRRMFNNTKSVFQKAKELDSDIYHFHDPELIPVGLKLKKLGKKVIFDIHEDVEKQILAKPYHPVLKKILSFTYRLYEKHTTKVFDYLITPTPIINTKFLSINPKTAQVTNYPILKELLNDTPWETRENSLCHIGSLAQSRGVKELIQSLQFSQIKLSLCGNFIPQALETEMKNLKAWNYVDFHGFISREEVKKVLSTSKIGLVTFIQSPSYLEAIPVKMFEYMAAGIPVIASDFPLNRQLLDNCLNHYYCSPNKMFEYLMAEIPVIVSNLHEMKKIVNEYKVGVVAEDNSVEGLKHAIENAQMQNQKEMLKNIKNIKKIYNWEVQEKILLKTYKEISS